MSDPAAVPPGARPATPKFELHVHLEGTVEPVTLLGLARRNGLRLPADTVAGLEKMYRFTSLDQFINAWIQTTNCLRTAEDFRQITVEYIGRVVALGWPPMSRPSSRPQSGLKDGDRAR
ncbi:hypothetical protein [Streptomyces rimosus]|uniref:hypothetical protein n=1 Tax=Streptomyces rimosus TaxID=1927 RepID=UPI0004C661C1|nr:hypothetical protein [Streptomyces rimosus]